MSIQALREQRAAKAMTLNELVSKAEWNAAVDQPIYDAGLAELDDLDARISRINAVNAKVAEDALTHHVAERAERAGVDAKSDGAKIYAKWLRGGDAALSAQEWQTVRNTMSTTTDSQGGYTVATEVATSVLDALKAFGGMRSVAQIIQTSQGNPMSFPTSDGTSEVGEIVAQNGSAASADVSFSTLALPVYKYSSKVVTVPFELLQDSNVDIEAFVRSRLATRLGRITNTHFTAGSGSSQPNGVFTAATSGVTAAGTTTITYAELINAVHSVDPAYRQQNCRWMMHDSTVKIIRKLVDGQSRPIFNPGYEQGVPGGAPDSLLGYPITVNQDAPAMTTGLKPIAFGDFSYYMIRDVMAVEMFRFTDSVYTKAGQVGFLAWMRSGGNLIDVGGAIKLVTMA